MIVEFHDGMELELSDSLTDAQVQSIVEAMTKAKTVAATALASAEDAQANVVLLRERLDAAPAPRDNGDVVAELRQLQASIERGFQRMFAAQMADTVLVQDPLRDEPVRAEKVIR